MIKAALSSTAALTLTFVLLASMAFGEGFPTEALQPYDTFREKMIEAGWTPSETAGEGMLQDYPELSCGTGLCTATWHAPVGWERSDIEVFTVWPDVTGFRLAPQF